jgi:hypothetical protein
MSSSFPTNNGAGSKSNNPTAPFPGPGVGNAPPGFGFMPMNGFNNVPNMGHGPPHGFGGMPMGMGPGNQNHGHGNPNRGAPNPMMMNMGAMNHMGGNPMHNPFLGPPFMHHPNSGHPPQMMPPQHMMGMGQMNPFMFSQGGHMGPMGHPFAGNNLGPNFMGNNNFGWNNGPFGMNNFGFPPFGPRGPMNPREMAAVAAATAANDPNARENPAGATNANSRVGRLDAETVAGSDKEIKDENAKQERLEDKVDNADAPSKAADSKASTAAVKKIKLRLLTDHEQQELGPIKFPKHEGILLLT